MLNVALAATKTWTNANGNGNWNTAGNWSPSGVPSSSDDVVFNSTSTTNCTVNGNRTAGKITISSGYTGTITLNGNLTANDDVELNAGTLDVGNNSFTVKGDYQQNAGTFNGATGTLVFEGDFTQNNGTFTASSNSTEFRKDITKNGGTYNHNNGVSVLKGNGSRNVNSNTSNRLVYHNLRIELDNNETLNSSDTLVVNNLLELVDGKVDNAILESRGHVNIANGYDGGNAQLIFAGNVNQNFSDASSNRNLFKGKVIIRKTGGANVTLTSPIRLNGSNQSIEFSSGLVISSNTNLLEIGDNVTATGANANSFVSGPVRKTGNDAFTFPVGKNGKFAPISISAPSNSSHHFTAEYFATNPNSLYNVNSKSATLATVSTAEYWILDRTSGNSNVNVTMSWNSTRSGGVSNTGHLRVARWNGTQWQDHGASNVSGNTSAGTLTTSAAVTSFSPFTLGSTNSSTQLPVELISFTASKAIAGIELKWTTSSELNNAGFEVQRSADGFKFSTIGFVDGNGTTNLLNHYTYIDASPIRGVNYYRLKQVDFNGTFEYTSVVAEQFTLPVQVTIFPNPTTEKLYIESTWPINQIKVFNSIGEMMPVEIFKKDNLTEINVNGLKPETYFVQVVQGTSIQTKRFVVKK